MSWTKTGVSTGTVSSPADWLFDWPRAPSKLEILWHFVYVIPMTFLNSISHVFLYQSQTFSDVAQIGKFGRAMSRLNLNGPMRKRINGIRFKQCWDDIQVMNSCSNSTKSAVQLPLNLLNHLVHAHFILGRTQRRPLMAHLMGTLAPTEAVSVSNYMPQPRDTTVWLGEIQWRWNWDEHW